ncbi:hypothetical protein PanWU01x14_003840 [Parasponia andersonii]|uniref:DUF506 family protein n=1 Tax=Parasponia andersonii TaxID=3476 RepID=A0A2P5E311_PARAD|nr:hypothetical protein PanWU01x14_003840 [Parasponia andersonii]
MKIQPVDIESELVVRTDSAKPVLKSRFRRLFDRQFPSVLKVSSAEKPSNGESTQYKDGGAGATEFEPSSVCLDKMVQNFIEESHHNSNSESQPARPPAAKCGRNRCNCFNANSNDSSDDEFDVLGGGFGDSVTSGSYGGDASDILKSLIPCASVAERNLLADTAKIVEKNKNHKRKDDLIKIVTDGLSSNGYDSSICKSKWEKSSSFPAGEYEYIDVIIQGERLLLDIDFKSEFEIARSTGAYKAILQSLPYIFVGKPDRLGQIVSIVSEAAKQSLKKKGMHFPPWRQAEYMRAKWLSSHHRNDAVSAASEKLKADGEARDDDDGFTDCGELELIFGESSPSENDPGGVAAAAAAVEEKSSVKVMTWQPPAIKPKSVERGAKVVTGLASLLKEKP